LGSLRLDVISKHGPAIPDFERRLTATPVRCITFESLCRLHRVEAVDLIEIDTEGYDFEVIKLIDLDRFRPRLVIYEHLHLEPDARAECSEHMRRHGYEEISDVLNTACFRTVNLGRQDRRLMNAWRRVAAELA
jgi:hypothetical protein